MKAKPIRKILVSLGFLTAIALTLISSCKRKDTIEPFSTATDLGDTLFSRKVTTAPTIDGTAETFWENLPQISVTATVPNLAASIARPGCDVFGGYEGDQYTVKIRTAHDAANIYFLVEWNDATLSQDRNSWYFDTATKRWKQQDTYGCSNGVSGTPFYEDKFSFMWNINTPASSWNSSTCYTNCHSGLVAPWKDVVKHYTNSPGEMVDVWHWKFVRNNYVGQLDDQRWIYADPTNPADPGKGGRGDDAKTGGGYSDNKQNLKLTEDTSITVSVPKYVIPNQTGYYWITPTDISSGSAKLITAVDTNGVLSYNGGTIIPSTGGYENGTGAKRIPSVSVATSTGSLGDVSAFGKHTGSGWVLEIKRALTTGNSDDAAFSAPGVYKFGIGVFDNSGIAHAIKTNMTMKIEE